MKAHSVPAPSIDRGVPLTSPTDNGAAGAAIRDSMLHIPLTLFPHAQAEETVECADLLVLGMFTSAQHKKR
jgi:hypothetical protein